MNVAGTGIRQPSIATLDAFLIYKKAYGFLQNQAQIFAKITADNSRTTLAVGS